MILKAVTFFLIGIVILAMFGRLRIPKPKLPGRKPKQGIADATKCPKCGGYMLAGTTCNCGYKAGDK